MVELKEPFSTLWRGKDPFEEVKTLQGEVFRELETRRTLRFEMAGKSYFLKWHR
ncbi:lipopolysaccharide core heptose(I) kinase RfaP, partial [Escherichia coli]|nr:lipopolysaccharide core heptose(I) kinase RfaP [Escherichia coli]